MWSVVRGPLPLHVRSGGPSPRGTQKQTALFYEDRLVVLLRGASARSSHAPRGGRMVPSRAGLHRSSSIQHSHSSFSIFFRARGA